MKRFLVEGMSCQACVNAVEKAVEKVEGVDGVEVNLMTNSMMVEGTFLPSIVISAVENAGYKAYEYDSAIHKKKADDKKINKNLMYVAFTAVMIPVLLYLEIGIDMMQCECWLAVVSLEIVLSLIVIVVNRRYFVSGIKALIKRYPNMDTLVALGSSVAWLYSIFAVIRYLISDNLVRPQLHFTTSAMILTFISLGKMLEKKAKNKTVSAIEDLKKLESTTALRIISPEESNEGLTEEVPIGDVKVGDIILVEAGNHMPVDGVVVCGEGFADESGLTGESRPVHKKADDEVYTSTTLVRGSIQVKAERVGDNTSLAEIIGMVENAAMGKPPIRRLADKVAAIFVPTILLLAILTFTAWYSMTGNSETAFVRAVAVLVVSCPCAMGLATPVAVMVAGTVGVKHNLLFKNSESMEAVGKTDIVVLDKTGTLTEGNVRLPEETTEEYSQDKHFTDSDKLKADSRDAVGAIRKLGIRVVMLTGDNDETAAKIAKEAGIEEYIAEVRPGGKAEEIRKLKESGCVTMVGDGINDAVALTEADVGMALGSGKDVAVDAADVVLMNKSLMLVADAIRLSRLSIRKIKQNLFWAFAYNIIGIPLAAGVLIPICGWEMRPAFGAAAMSLSGLIVVCNALTINRFNFTTIGKKENEIMNKTVLIEGMMCPHCEARMKACFEETEGVEEAVVSHEKGNAVLSLSCDVSDSVLEQVVINAGYIYKGIL